VYTNDVAAKLEQARLAAARPKAVIRS